MCGSSGPRLRVRGRDSNCWATLCRTVLLVVAGSSVVDAFAGTATSFNARATPWPIPAGRCCPRAYSLAMAATAPAAPKTPRRLVLPEKLPAKQDGQGREAAPSGGIGRALREKLSHMASWGIIMAIGITFRILLQGFNKVEVHNRETLINAVMDREEGRGLLTVSNHMSFYDDPGLWAAVIPFWKTGVKKTRWSLCNDDVYFASKPLTAIFRAGRTLPIKRRKGLEQPWFEDFFKKLELGDWGHIFAEGAIRQPWRFGNGTPILADFKTGLGRLLARSSKLPIILPVYHIGMHRVCPEQPGPLRKPAKLLSAIPKTGCKVHVFIGEPLDVSHVIDKWRAKMGDQSSQPWTKRSTKAEIACHREIASTIRQSVLELEARARLEYYGDDPDSPYYGSCSDAGKTPSNDEFGEEAT